ncbi:MAG: sigma-54-dependent transcriptional response regulator, partial [Acidobacteria bacterium]|nr:sigma-54-dependent transcriptional response regulator [Acidobacteriota bacterium]
MTKRLIAILILMAALFGGAAARGSDEVPRFLIERIDVRNLRHASPEIVRAESRLKEGSSYDERELAAASDRINRLPFILDAQFSLEHFCRGNGRAPLSVDGDVLAALRDYDWPGNIRELRNLAERLSVFGTDPITLDQLPSSLFTRRDAAETG